MHPSELDTVYGLLEETPVTTSMLSWVSGLNQQVANLSFILNGPQVRILRSAPFWVDMQIGWSRWAVNPWRKRHCRFKSCSTHHIIYWDVAKQVRHQTLNLAFPWFESRYPSHFFWWSCIQVRLRKWSATPLSLVQIQSTPPKFRSCGGSGRHVSLRN